MQKGIFRAYVDSTGQGQPVHLHNLIEAFTDHSHYHRILWNIPEIRAMSIVLICNVDPNYSHMPRAHLFTCHNPYKMAYLNLLVPNN